MFIIVWLIAISVLFVASVVCALLCLNLEGAEKSRMINALLICATLTVAVNISQVLIPKNELEKGKKAMESLKLSATREAEMTGAGLSATSYRDKLTEPWISMARLDGFKSYADSLKNAEDALKQLADKNPQNAGVVARLAIVTHENGGKVDEIFTKYDKTLDDPLVHTLADVYTNGRSADPDTQAVLKQYVSPGQPLDAAEEKVLKESLSPGWYQKRALISYYTKAASDMVQKVVAADEASENAWAARYIAYQIFRWLMTVVFLFLAFRLVRVKKEPFPPFPITFGFRQAYGCLLTSAWVQCIVGFCVGMWIGAMFALHSKSHGSEPMQMGNFSLTFITITLSISTAAALTAAYFFIGRPAKISIWQFYSGNTKVQPKQFVLYSLATFGAIFGSNSLLHLLQRLTKSAPTDSGSFIMGQLMDAILSANPMTLAVFMFTLCVLAPVAEELLFRGLGYAWIRSKIGVGWAVVLSAALFAAWHMDPPRFFQHMLAGIALAIVYEKSRNLWVSVSSHALWNAGVVVVLLALVPN